MLGKKSSQNIAKKRFLIHTSIVTKKWWKKTREKFFQKHTNSAGKKCGEKIIAKKCDLLREKMLGKKRRKNCEKTFSIFTRIS